MTTVYLPHACPEMLQFIDDERVPVVYEPRFREYSLALLQSGASQLIRFCPWCGAELPASLRDRFFDELERIGVDYASEVCPVAYGTDAWWRDGEPPVTSKT